MLSQALQELYEFAVTEEPDNIFSYIYEKYPETGETIRHEEERKSNWEELKIKIANYPKGLAANYQIHNVFGTTLVKEPETTIDNLVGLNHPNIHDLILLDILKSKSFVSYPFHISNVFKKISEKPFSEVDHYQQMKRNLSPTPDDLPSKKKQTHRKRTPIPLQERASSNLAQTAPQIRFPFLNHDPPIGIFSSIISKNHLRCILETECVGQEDIKLSKMEPHEAWRYCDTTYFIPNFDDRRRQYDQTDLQKREDKTATLIKETVKEVISVEKSQTSELQSIVIDLLKKVNDLQISLESNNIVPPSVSTVRPVFTPISRTSSTSSLGQQSQDLPGQQYFVVKSRRRTAEAPMDTTP